MGESNSTKLVGKADTAGRLGSSDGKKVSPTPGDSRALGVLGVLTELARPNPGFRALNPKRSNTRNESTAALGGGLETTRSYAQEDTWVVL